jgi:hypothetical protein
MRAKHTLIGTMLAATTLAAGVLLPAHAQTWDRHGRYDHDGGHHGGNRHDRDYRHEHRRYPAYPRYPAYRHPHHPPPPRWGAPRYGYGYPYASDKAFKYMGATAVALGFLDLLNAEQQRRHETAMMTAVGRPGEVIVWELGGATGSVTTVREGATSSGRHCREFQQSITVGGRTERAYGTACLTPDGSWELVESR